MIHLFPVQRDELIAQNNAAKKFITITAIQAQQDRFNLQKQKTQRNQELHKKANALKQGWQHRENSMNQRKELMKQRQHMKQASMLLKRKLIDKRYDRRSVNSTTKISPRSATTIQQSQSQSAHQHQHQQPVPPKQGKRNNNRRSGRKNVGRNYYSKWNQRVLHAVLCAKGSSIATINDYEPQQIPSTFPVTNEAQYFVPKKTNKNSNSSTTSAHFIPVAPTIVKQRIQNVSLINKSIEIPGGKYYRPQTAPNVSFPVEEQSDILITSELMKKQPFSQEEMKSNEFTKKTLSTELQQESPRLSSTRIITTTRKPKMYRSIAGGFKCSPRPSKRASSSIAVATMNAPMSPRDIIIRQFQRREVILAKKRATRAMSRKRVTTNRSNKPVIGPWNNRKLNAIQIRTNHLIVKGLHQKSFIPIKTNFERRIQPSEKYNGENWSSTLFDGVDFVVG
jgi:hypothetical protein